MCHRCKEIKGDKEERPGETGKVSKDKVGTKSFTRGARDSQSSQSTKIKSKKNPKSQHGVNCKLESF